MKHLTGWMIAAAGTGMAVATPASAADFFLTVGPGTTSTDFGATANTSGVLDDRYFFTVQAGTANGFVGSIALSALLDVNLDDVRLDSTPFVQEASDGTELWTLDPTAIEAGTHFIRIVGTWGPQGGSYAGTLNYAPTTAAVPEPGGWAMMLAGFWLVGLGARYRPGRRRVTFG